MMQRTRIYVVESGPFQDGDSDEFDAVVPYCGTLYGAARAAIMDESGEFISGHHDLGAIRSLLPAEVRFWCCLKDLDFTDSPITNKSWDIVSRKLYEAMHSVGHFEDATVPIIFDQHPMLQAALQGRPPDPAVLAYTGLPSGSREDFLGLIPPIVDCLDVARSTGVEIATNRFTNEKFDFIKHVDRPAFVEPRGGFPPVFKVATGTVLGRKTSLPELFVSEEARAAIIHKALKVNLVPHEV
jgi:hypothetical protein